MSDFGNNAFPKLWNDLDVGVLHPHPLLSRKDNILQKKLELCRTRYNNIIQSYLKLILNELTNGDNSVDSREVLEI